MDINKYRDVATQIVIDGFAAESSADEIKMNLMGAGVPFSALNAVVKTISIEEGLLVDPKIVTNDLGEKIEACDWESIEDWDQLEALGNQLADAVEGATFARAITLARAYAKNELDLALPKKPRAAGGGGKGRVGAIAQAVVELISTNNNPTKQEFYDAMVPVVGGDQQHANIIYYMGLHQAVCMAVAQARPLAEVVEQLAQETNPQPGEGVSAVPRGSHAEEDLDEEDEDEEMAA